MSFSTDVKEELSKISNLADKASVKAEMFGYLNTINVSKENDSIKFSTESEYNINRFNKLLNNLEINIYKIEIIGKSFCITIPKNMSNKLEEKFIDYKITSEENIEKAFIRGVFLGSGSINNPNNKYHMELIVKKLDIAEKILDILENYNIKFKLLKNKNKNNKFWVYSKDGEEISKFLAFVGANSSVIKFEEIRVYRDMRNNVNRIVNCETANLSKTIDAALKQINAINKLKENGIFNKLPENLQEIANLRIENPEASLVELGNMLNEPIGKSGVNYRLKTIIKIAEES